MYTCARCKKVFDDEPALKNGAGSFCYKCRSVMIENMQVGLKRRREKMRGICVWCGDTVTPATSSNGNEDDHVCRKCDRNRTWLLQCIRYSDKAAKYVVRVEEKEAPARNAREIEIMRLQEQEDSKIDALPTEIEFRMQRLEEMLTKLSQELGVI